MKFLGHLCLQKLYDVVVPRDENNAPDPEKNANAFAELVQCLDDKSLALISREAKDDGRKALTVLRQHYQGKEKPRVIALYTELTSLKLRETESTTDYKLRAEKTATTLKSAEETISDGLLVATVLKGLPENFKTFSTVITQREAQIPFTDFKTALRNCEETEKSCKRTIETGDNVMVMKQKFQGNCVKCGRKGHKSRDCHSKHTVNKWCQNCKNSSHNTKDCRRKQGEAAKKIEEKPVEEGEKHECTCHLRDQKDGVRGKNTSNLLLETGATSHIIVDRKDFISVDENFNVDNHIIELADGSRTNVVQGKGNTKVNLCVVNGNVQDIIVNTALYIPSYDQNIFSVSTAVDKGACISINKEGM